MTVGCVSRREKLDALQVTGLPDVGVSDASGTPTSLLRDAAGEPGAVDAVAMASSSGAADMLDASTDAAAAPSELMTLDAAGPGDAAATSPQAGRDGASEAACTQLAVCEDELACYDSLPVMACPCARIELSPCSRPSLTIIGPARSSLQLTLYAISGDGSTILGYDERPVATDAGERSSGKYGVVWRADTGVQPLQQDPAGPTVPIASNFDGTIITGLVEVEDGEDIPVVWRDGVLQRRTDLEPLWESPEWAPETGQSRAPLAVWVSTPDRSLYAGTVEGNQLPTEAAIWTEAEGVRTVRDELERLGLDPGNWILERVNGVSWDGKTIFGLGLGYRAVRWVVHLP